VVLKWKKDKLLPYQNIDIMSNMWRDIILLVSNVFLSENFCSY